MKTKSLLPELREKQTAFLNETIAFYNKNNRCSIDGTCLYYHHTKPGCAIGRHIKDKELCKRLDNGEFGGMSVDNTRVFNALPVELRRLEKEFLVRVQKLHDDEQKKYWDESGLTVGGLEEVDSIRKRFGLV